jgi:hypothetical protein
MERIYKRNLRKASLIKHVSEDKTVTLRIISDTAIDKAIKK